MSQWDGYVQAAAQKYNVDPRLIHSVIQVESGGDPTAYAPESAQAIPSGGARGLGQQTPATAKALGIDPTDPQQSIEGIAKLLDQNLNRYGSPQQAILAYHGGTNQDNWGPKTRDYLQKVTSQYGAPAMAQPATQLDPRVAQAFSARFGFIPGSNKPAAIASAPDYSAFKDRFGFVPGEPASAPVVAPAASQAQPQASAPPISPAQAAGPQPGMLQQGADAAWNGLQSLGAQGLSNANAVGRGIMDAMDAPSEWLAAGAEKSGLTGLLGKAGINMPTAEQQTQLNAQSRAEYDARNPDAGLQGAASRIGGNILGVMAPIAGAEAGITKGGQLLSNALGNPELLAKAGQFVGGQGGLASRMTYNALQGAAGGALLSGGQPGASTADAAGMGAIMGGAIPVAGAAAKYLGNTARSLVAPFTDAGRAGIAQRMVQGEAAKDPLNQAQNLLTPGAPPSANPSPPVPLGGSADDALNRAASGGRMQANFNELVPGSQPTLAQATGNGGLAALERAAMSRAPNAFTERQLANYQARNAYLDQIKGTPDTLAAAAAQRDQTALPMLQDALANARPANANPVLDTIDSILKTGEGQRPAVASALNQVRNKIDLGDGQGAQTSVEQLYGIRKAINDQLENVAGRDNSSAQQASRQLIQVRDSLDNSIQQAAPGFKEFLSTYADLSKPINAQSYLQGLNLTDAASNRITLPSVKNALLKIDKLRAAPGANDAKAITDEQMGMLRNLHADLQREANSARGMSIGSNTFQNLATNQLIDSMMPGVVGKIAPLAPGTLGGLLGHAVGGPAGAAMGAMGAQQAAGVLGRAMNAQGPEIEARLIDYLLNPRGAEVLRQAGGSQTPAMDALLRRSAPVAPASLVTPSSNQNR